MYIANLLFIIIIIILLYQIYIIKLNYNNNISISNIICNLKNNNLYYSLIALFITVLLYECYRNDYITLTLTSMLLLLLIKLICTIDHSLEHQFIAILIFICINIFMLHNNNKINNNILQYSLILQFIIIIYVIKIVNINKIFTSEEYRKNLNIFLPETFLISNFGFFYIYLHYLEFIKIKYD